MAAKSTKKTAGKTAKRRRPKRKKGKQPPSPRSGVSLPAGAHEGNTGGKAGRSGRIPNELKHSSQDLAFETIFPKLARYLRSTKKNPSDAGWRWAASVILDRGFGKVPQPITGDDEGDPIGVRVEREQAALARILGALARISERSAKD